MSLLSYTKLCSLVEQGIITAKMSQVNGSSIDITLDRFIRAELQYIDGRITSITNLKEKENINTKEIDIVLAQTFDANMNTICGYSLSPDEFVLASSHEYFNLPDNISCEYKLKSSMARNGLEHLNAGWCDAGWHGSKLTLELKDMTRYHRLLLTEGMPIGQVVFFEHEPVPSDKSYAVRGQYNNQEKVTESKGIR